MEPVSSMRQEEGEKRSIAVVQFAAYQVLESVNLACIFSGARW